MVVKFLTLNANPAKAALVLDARLRVPTASEVLNWGEMLVVYTQEGPEELVDRCILRDALDAEPVDEDSEDILIFGSEHNVAYRVNLSEARRLSNDTYDY